MATAKKHAERSKVKHNDTQGRDAFFNKCIYYADLRKKAKEAKKANV